jgi:hypothetical protein
MLRVSSSGGAGHSLPLWFCGEARRRVMPVALVTLALVLRGGARPRIQRVATDVWRGAVPASMSGPLTGPQLSCCSTGTDPEQGAASCSWSSPYPEQGAASCSWSSPYP